MKKKRVPLAMGQAIDMAVLPRKSLADAKQTPKLRAFAAANGLDETAELVMLPFLPPSPVANSKYGDIVYDQAAFCASFNAQGKWKPIDLGHALLFDAAAPSQGWVVELAPHVKDPAHTGAWCLLTEKGRQAVSGMEYGHTSPVLLADERNGQLYPTSVHSLALTNTPACYDQLLAFSDGETPTLVVDVDEAEEQAEDASTEQAAEPATAGIEASEAATEGAGPTEAAEAAQTPAEAQEEAAATETTALSATAPTAPSAPSADVVALTASVTSLTTERDTAKAQVVALTSQVTALTSQVAALTEQLKAFESAELERKVLSALNDAQAAGKTTPAQREKLASWGRKDFAAFSEYVASLKALPAFSAPVATHSGDAEPLSPSEAQRERFARAANVTLSKT